MSIDYQAVRNDAIELVRTVYANAVADTSKSQEESIVTFNSLLAAILDLTYDSFLLEVDGGNLEEVRKLLEQSRED